jgi:hypothetical protein
MKILTIFSGRKRSLEILLKYLKTALQLNIIDEVHFWNYTKNNSDQEYLQSISNLKRTSSLGSGNYILITPIISNNSFELDVKASNDIHIKMTNLKTNYEIVLGGWENTFSVIRENNTTISGFESYNIADPNTKINIKIKIENNILRIFKNKRLLVLQKIVNDFQIKEIYFKTGHRSVACLTYNTTQNENFYLMDACEKKNWKDYYNYYNNPIYVNDIILKCDDDIVFVDLLKLPKFINFIENNDYDLVFANIINNGVAAHFQQNKYNLIPRELMKLEYPLYGQYGTLWESGEKAETLHMYFIENYNTFLEYDYKNEIIPINTRFSINFFGYKGKNWHKICDCYDDDEHVLTHYYPKEKNFKNILYPDFYVSHLSFYKQIETGIHLDILIDKYNELYYKMEPKYIVSNKT